MEIIKCWQYMFSRSIFDGTNGVVKNTFNIGVKFLSSSTIKMSANTGASELTVGFLSNFLNLFVLTIEKHYQHTLFYQAKLPLSLSFVSKLRVAYFYLSW